MDKRINDTEETAPLEPWELELKALEEADELRHWSVEQVSEWIKSKILEIKK